MRVVIRYASDMKVLGRIRLSRLTDESTSAARQRELIDQWAATQGHTVVGWAEDLDVSGSVDPFETPALGPWLTKEKAGEWDILCAWKLDRVGRSAIQLNRVFGWIIDNDKQLVCVSDSIDLSTWVGRLIASVIAGVAEGELESIKERTRASRKKLLESGRWPGGAVPYGLLPKKNAAGDGWVLVADPNTSEIVHRICREIIDGQSVRAVTETLNNQNIPAPRGGAWKVRTIWQLVTAKYLLGHATYGRETVRDKNGMPVLNAEPLLTQQEWDDLQAAVAARRSSPMRTKRTSPLLGVVLCYECRSNMHHHIYPRDKHEYRYYYCQKCKSASVQAETVEEMLEEAFLDAVGDKNMMEKVFIPAETHQIELEDARRAVGEITDLLGTMTSDTVRSRLTEQIRALDFRIEALEKLPQREAGFEYKNTGLTFGTAWTNSNQEERRQLLLRSGITYRVKRITDTKVLIGELYVPDEILDRLGGRV